MDRHITTAKRAPIDAADVRARRSLSAGTPKGFVLRLAASVGLLVMLTGCGPWVGMPTVWGGATRTIVDAPYSQATIDAGEVDNWSGCWPGQGCTVHLAAHRSSHGSTFARVPSLKPGDIVDLGYNGRIYHYRVDSLQIQPRSTDSNLTVVGDLVLQTSHPNPTVVYMVYATLISSN